MSAPSIPKVVISFDDGSVVPPQADVLDLIVHLGCTKEISSFEMLLQDWNGKYAKAGTGYTLTVGMKAEISVGREPNAPLILTGTIEEIECREYAEEDRISHYIVVKGRCYGLQLFGKLVTRRYVNTKGEAIVKDVIDNYTTLSHVRNTTELIEDTDTTYTELVYIETPVFDIIKFIAANSDKAGVIGYDFRIEYDGKFAFFPRNSKTSSVSLSEALNVGIYNRSILKKRDRFYVHGAALKSDPVDTDGWTEPDKDASVTDPTEYSTTDSGAYVLKSTITLVVPASKKITGHRADLQVRVTGGTGYYKITYQKEGEAETTIVTDEPVTNTSYQNKYHVFNHAGNMGQDITYRFYIKAPPGQTIYMKNTKATCDGFYADWNSTTGFPRADDGVMGSTCIDNYMIGQAHGELYLKGLSKNLLRAESPKKLIFELMLSLNETSTLSYIDVQLRTDATNYFYQRIYTYAAFGSRQWQHVDIGIGPKAEGWSEQGSPDWSNITEVRVITQVTDGGPFAHHTYVDGLYFAEARYTAMAETGPGALRERSIVDEELYSDAECSLRANALLDFSSTPRDAITIISDVIDYGTNRLQPADKIQVVLPEINVDKTLRMPSIEIRASGTHSTLTVTIELGKEADLLADYLYALKKRTEKSMRYKVEA